MTTKTKTPARPDVPAAEARLNSASDRFRIAQNRLLELEKANPRERAKPSWVRDHESTQREVVESAYDLEDAIQTLDRAKVADLERRHDEYKEALPEIRSERHDLAVELDGLLSQVEDLTGKIITLCEKERQAATRAEVNALDLERIRRTLVSRLVFALPSLRLRPDITFSIHTHARKPLGELFIGPKEVAE